MMTPIPLVRAPRLPASSPELTYVLHKTFSEYELPPLDAEQHLAQERNLSTVSVSTLLAERPGRMSVHDKMIIVENNGVSASTRHAGHSHSPSPVRGGSLGISMAGGSGGTDGAGASTSSSGGGGS